MSRNLQTQQVVIQRLNTLEQEIREIRKAVTQETIPFPEFPVIMQEQQVEQAEQAEFNCTLCCVTKPINQRERKGKQKSSVCKRVLIIGLKSDMNVFVEVHFRDGG